MIVSHIVAVAENGVIGKDNALPWRLPADLRYFKERTKGHTIVMGRKTFDSLGKPLPDRRHLVISRNEAYKPDGVQVFDNLENALKEAEISGETEVFIIGGSEIFALSMPFCNRLYITRILAEFDGDTFYTLPDSGTWRLLSAKAHVPDEKNTWPFVFEVYEK